MEVKSKRGKHRKGLVKKGDEGQIGPSWARGEKKVGKDSSRLTKNPWKSLRVGEDIGKAGVGARVREKNLAISLRPAERNRRGGDVREASGKTRPADLRAQEVGKGGDLRQ